jgi:FlgN protein
MTPETSQYLELLEQRIVLLGSLASSLVSARVGIVSLDIDGLEQRIREQERLCVDIRSLDAEIDAIQKKCANHLGLTATTSMGQTTRPDAVRLQETLARLNQAQLSLKKLNSAHQILLRRSRRTVGSLLNSYHSFAMTYTEPTAIRSTMGERA